MVNLYYQRTRKRWVNGSWGRSNIKCS